MFQGLEAAHRPAELVTLVQPLHAPLQHRGTDAVVLGGHGEIQGQQPRGEFPGAAGMAHRLGTGLFDQGQRAARVEARQCLAEGRPVGGRVLPVHLGAAVIASMDAQQAEATGQCRVLGKPSWPRLAGRGRHLVEHAPGHGVDVDLDADTATEVVQHRAQHGAAQPGSAEQTRTEFLAHGDQFHRAETGTAVVLVDQQGAPAEFLGHGKVLRGDVVGRSRVQAKGFVGRAVGQRATHAVAQAELVVVVEQVHRGRPSPRSAMMLRMMSEVPARMVSARVHRAW